MPHSISMPSPLGQLVITSDGNAIARVDFSDAHIEEEISTPVLDAARVQLEEYFRGERTEFELELAPQCTDFEKRVWSELLKIPFGETRSYMEVANALHSPKAVRAVGGANGRNPIAIIVPCHRVIGADGSLTGYGGGIHRKHWLLELEAKTSGSKLSLF